MTDPAPPVIEIRDLHKAYGRLEVLRRCQPQRPQGRRGDADRLIGIGQINLLRCCNLLENSQRGEVLFEGEPVEWRGEGARRHPVDRAQLIRIRTNLSMVFQQFNLWSHMTVLQNVTEAPVTVLKRDREEAEASARAYLTKVGIGDKCDAYPAQLSGGSSSARRLPGRCAWNRGHCCSTNPPRPLTPNWSKRSSG